MEAFEVLRPGALTTVQDLGRRGYQQYGVPVAGAMDEYALRVGNLILGNDEGDAALEMTVIGPRLRFLADAFIAITGGDLSPRLDGEPVPLWQAVGVRRGGVLSFGALRKGCRAYLTMAGGVDVPRLMGSRATYVRANLGGFEGRPLRTGDVLQGGEPKTDPSGRKLDPRYIPEYGGEIEARVVLGPQDDYFTDRGIETLFGEEYVISGESDRMGYRLQGPAVEHRAGADIISDGIPLGAVQVPADGRPIILLADRQTTGGYTKIAVVISADIPKLGQARPGDRVRFSRITEAAAVQALRDYEATIREIKTRVGR